MAHAGTARLGSVECLGIIPARGGSKAIPRKNLIDVAGKPLLAYTIDAALQSRRLHRVILSTDDPEIARVGRDLGVEVPFLRPAPLAVDEAPTVPVLRHVVDELAAREGYQPAAIALLQPTSPLRRAAHLDAAIELFVQEGADSVVSVSEPLEHPCDMVSCEEGRMTFALPVADGAAGRQRYPAFHFLNGAIYIMRTAMLRTAIHPWGGKIIPYMMEPLDSIDVDSAAHLRLAELLLQQRMSLRTS
jgi:CMP-N-acetylneuraminic acid synthetase